MQFLHHYPILHKKDNHSFKGYRVDCDYTEEEKKKENTETKNEDEKNKQETTEN